jgi:low temperature requirement protein LtrA
VRNASAQPSGRVEKSWQWATSLVGASGLVIATGLWWIHFDNVDGYVVRRRGAAKAWRPTAWIYSHLPLAIGLAMVGVGTEHAIVAADGTHDYHTEDRWVFLFGAMLALAAMALIEFASIKRGHEHLKRRIVGNRLIAIALVAGVGALAFLGPVATVILVGIVVAIQVGIDVLAETVPE